MNYNKREPMPKSIALYVDDMLEGEEKSKMEAHLLICPTCSDFAAELLDTKNTLAGLEPAPLPENFGPRLRTAIASEKMKNSFRLSRWKSLRTLAAIIMVGFISYSMYMNMLIDPANPVGESTMMKSASIGQQEDEKYYQDLIQNKLMNYTYETISISSDPAEFKILIKKDHQGNPINKEYTIQYGDGKISSIDNWLNINF